MRSNLNLIVALTLCFNLFCILTTYPSQYQNQRRELRMDHKLKFEGYAPKRSQRDNILQDLENKMKHEFGSNDQIENDKKVEISH